MVRQQRSSNVYVVVCLAPNSLTAGCAALMTVGNLIKKVVIKLLAAHFHKEAHFQRMQEALRKVSGTACLYVVLHTFSVGCSLARSTSLYSDCHHRGILDNADSVPAHTPSACNVRYLSVLSSRHAGVLPLNPVPTPRAS
jgi:hypothetical protein